MIKKASELLAALIAVERGNVESIIMPHMPTLGAAYEAIVANGIDQQFVLPPKLDLRVVSGFIQELPNQIDCMVVRGEGQRYGLTDNYIYPIEQVLCVLEVKKTMTKDALVDGIGHLAEVQRHFIENFKLRLQSGDIHDFAHAVDTFSKITGHSSPLTAQELDNAPVEEQMLFSTLAKQMYAPTTVLLGFGGYGTENGLREALVSFLETNVGKESNAAPELLPSLISVSDLCLVKCNGQPYILLDGTDQWVAVASTRHNAALVLLELIWTKIARFCSVAMPFGPEVETESLEPVLTARGAQKEDKLGWCWHSYQKTERQLKGRPAALPWEPVSLSAASMSLTNQMAFAGGLIELDDGLRKYIKSEYGAELDTVAAELVRTSAFCLRGRRLQVVPPLAVIASLPDGTGFAARSREPLAGWCAERGLDPIFMQIVWFE